MSVMESSRLWKTAIEELGEPDLKAAEKLAISFEDTRAAVANLAPNYQQYLPYFTLHDIEHFDALWSIADTLTPDGYKLSPLEVYILGLTFLTHDLGMAIATYPGGEAEIRETPLFKDLHKVAEGRLTNGETLDEGALIGDFLRRNHAHKAESLLSLEFGSGSDRRFLIENSDLRKAVQAIAGQIAASHHWSIERVKKDLRGDYTAAVPLGGRFPLRPKLLAGLLRVCDACHITVDRVPFWAKVGRPIDGVSELHWNFHSHLNPIAREGSRLQFTSNDPFLDSESESWWCAYDAIHVAAKELKAVRFLFEDCGYPPLFSDEIEGADRPEALAHLVQTQGWEPADIRLQVSDVTHIVETLGGRKLYGDDNTVPIRELIQNARDAVKAREALGVPDSYRGRIDVRLIPEGEGEWLEVEDNGIGMTPRVMTGPLLDFGKSYWRSDDVLYDLPGLAASDFDAAGRFGIGFFSVFMLGDRVQVISNRRGEAASATKVLEFDKANGKRPILRAATEEEQIEGGGTRVRVWSAEPIKLPESLAQRFQNVANFSRQLRDRLNLCLTYLAPALDVDLCGRTANSPSEIIVTADDWKNLPFDVLDRRLNIPYGEHWNSWDNLTHLDGPWRDAEGNELGRLSLSLHTLESHPRNAVLVSKGLRCGLAYGAAGMLRADPATVARDSARPIPHSEALQDFVRQYFLKLKDEYVRLGRSAYKELLTGSVGSSFAPLMLLAAPTDCIEGHLPVGCRKEPVLLDEFMKLSLPFRFLVKVTPWVFLNEPLPFPEFLEGYCCDECRFPRHDERPNPLHDLARIEPFWSAVTDDYGRTICAGLTKLSGGTRWSCVKRTLHQAAELRGMKLDREEEDQILKFDPVFLHFLNEEEISNGL